MCFGADYSRHQEMSACFSYKAAKKQVINLTIKDNTHVLE